MSLLISAFKGLTCLTPMVAIPNTLTLYLQNNSRDARKLENYRNNCQLVVTNSYKDKVIIVCPVKQGSDEISFYLYQKSHKNLFLEVESWIMEENDGNLEIRTIKGEKTIKFMAFQNQVWNLLNNKILKKICKMNWNSNDSFGGTTMTCEGRNYPWKLNKWIKDIPQL